MTNNIERVNPLDIATEAVQAVFDDQPGGTPAEVVARNVVSFLVDAGLLTEPQIIRTVEELEALDPETLVQTPGKVLGWGTIRSASFLVDLLRTRPRNDHWLPAVVVATANQVRTARKALEEA